jgi:hypothetical protein
MTNCEWVGRMKEILERGESDSSGALDMVMKLAEESRTEANSSISTWHEEQALSHAATLYLAMDRRAEACDIFEQLAQRHRRTLNGAGHSAAQLLAEAAVARFQLGDAEAGARLAKEALTLFGQFPGPSVFLADALREWQRFEDEKQAGSGSFRKSR